MGDDSLVALEERMSAANLRGQWQMDSNRPQKVSKNQMGVTTVEPVPAGSTHVWRWSDVQPLLESACVAMPESFTARRALILRNPGLQRGTTHTLIASIQTVRPGEIAWSHRHVINALRFSIQGSEKVLTVVDGRELIMEPHDLILTPGWAWHDHHNESDRDAIWLDALDVPFTLALNQQFYEELGEKAQARVLTDQDAPLFRTASVAPDPTARPYRYAWRHMRQRIEGVSDADAWYGSRVEYINPLSGGPILPTIAAYVQVLPPGFDGLFHRSTASEIAFVIEGQGEIRLEDKSIFWSEKDSLALPNWSKRRFVNSSKSDRAVLFVLTDKPILEAFGYLKTEREETHARGAGGIRRAAAE